MDLHRNHKNNIWTTTRGHYFNHLTHTTFKQPWILLGQIITKIVVICVDIYFIKTVSG